MTETQKMTDLMGDLVQDAFLKDPHLNLPAVD